MFVEHNFTRSVTDLKGSEKFTMQMTTIPILPERKDARSALQSRERVSVQSRQGVKSYNFANTASRTDAFIHRVTDMTVADVCKTRPEVKFGVDYYQNPKYDHRMFMRKKNEDSLRKTLGFSKANQNRTHFTDAHAALYKGNS
jgi:hypothetical protein